MGELQKCLTVVLTAASLALGFCPARAAKGDDPPILDRDFVAQAITAAKAEIRLSELAGKEATDDKVKDFAQKVAKQQNLLADKLTDASRDLMIGVDYELEKKAKADFVRLEQLKGADFNREYMKLIVDNLANAANRMEREIKSGTNAAIKTVAEENVKRFKDSLKDARTLLDAGKDKKD